MFFFFKQKTAYEMRISDWSSDVCYSDLIVFAHVENERRLVEIERLVKPQIDRARHAAFDLIGGLRLEHVDALQRLRGQILEVERPAGGGEDKIGRESCRERVGQYGKISVGAGALKKHNNENI